MLIFSICAATLPESIFPSAYGKHAWQILRRRQFVYPHTPQCQSPAWAWTTITIM